MKGSAYNSIEITT